MNPSGKETGAPSRFLYFDVTFLRFAGDLRGIPQVIFTLLEVLRESRFRERVRFLAYADVAETHLLPRGIQAREIEIVPDVPWLGKFERFHGLFSTWRYRRIVKNANSLLHPEPRTVTRLPVPQIVFWHDVFEVDPGRAPWKKPSRYFYSRHKYRRAAKAEHAIANSGYTKGEVLRFFPGMDPESVRVLWLGVRRGITTAETAPEGLRLPLRCVYVGSLGERKNVFSLLASLRAVFGELPFVLNLVGKTSEAEENDAENILDKNGLRPSVVFHGLLPDDALGRLLRECQITLFPSLAEGFGLPVAEAMAHGHVVFAFRNTSIPEIGGDAIVLSESGDFNGWGSALRRLADRPEECAALRARALERSRLFSRDRVLERYRDYFEGFGDAVAGTRAEDG